MLFNVCIWSVGFLSYTFIKFLLQNQNWPSSAVNSVQKVSSIRLHWHCTRIHMQERHNVPCVIVLSHGLMIWGVIFKEYTKGSNWPSRRSDTKIQMIASPPSSLPITFSYSFMVTKSPQFKHTVQMPRTVLYYRVYV